MKSIRNSYVSLGSVLLLLLVISGIVILANTLHGTSSGTEKNASIHEWEYNDIEHGLVAGKDTSEVTEPSSQLEAQADRYRDFIGIDLNAMKLYWYKNGHVSYTYPILSQKNYLDDLEIPDGQHRIQYRNERHLTSTGDVYLPYIQQFYRNIAIHGWPSKANGGRVLEEYENDSIRLSTRDAKQLYKITTQDTPVIVTHTNRNTQTKENPSVPTPKVSASSYIIADIDTGQIIEHKQASEALSVASITKLMTAVVARENNNKNESVYISNNAVGTYGNSGNLSFGEYYTLDTLYLPLLLDSSNDAATAMAEHSTYKTFIELMNQKARILGMSATYFDDPSGLSDNNVSSAHDLLRLARYIWQYHRPIFDITTESMLTTPDPLSDGLRNFTNNNPLVGMSGYQGGKNGYTDRARHTLLSVFSIDTKSGMQNIVIIVLGSESQGDDTQILLSWLERTI
jgi:D-alanyl-D-alanine carboxypeptidase